eukprot:s126_g19.t1
MSNPMTALTSVVCLKVEDVSSSVEELAFVDEELTDNRASCNLCMWPLAASQPDDFARCCAIWQFVQQLGLGTSREYVEVRRACWKDLDTDELGGNASWAPANDSRYVTGYKVYLANSSQGEGRQEIGFLESATDTGLEDLDLDELGGIVSWDESADTAQVQERVYGVEVEGDQVADCRPECLLVSASSVLCVLLLRNNPREVAGRSAANIRHDLRTTWFSWRRTPAEMTEVQLVRHCRAPGLSLRWRLHDDRQPANRLQPKDHEYSETRVPSALIRFICEGQ